MLTCKQVSKALAENRFDDLPSHKKTVTQLMRDQDIVRASTNGNTPELKKMVHKKLSKIWKTFDWLISCEEENFMVPTELPSWPKTKAVINAIKKLND